MPGFLPLRSRAWLPIRIGASHAPFGVASQAIHVSAGEPYLQPILHKFLPQKLAQVRVRLQRRQRRSEATNTRLQPNLAPGIAAVVSFLLLRPIRNTGLEAAMAINRQPRNMLKHPENPKQPP